MAFDPLTPYVLKGVEVVSSEESKGQCGSYGFVYSVKVDGLLRIAKKPHSKILTQVSAAEKSRVLSNFKRECGLLSKLRHPNIVQFIGVYYERNSRDDMALVMEKLQFDLAQFVSSEPDIQLHMKLAILRDVTYGLVYLHEYNPPIIHRDLTARNILLTNSYQAKIADVGVSKLIDESARKASSYTQAPGQPNHMPPEALIKNPMYTSKLDIFSFGHVSLHTLVGDYPEVFEVLVTPAMAQEGTIQRMRRLISLDLIGSDHCLYPLITQCLMDNPDKRPTTREVNASVCLLAESHLKVAEESRQRERKQKQIQELQAHESWETKQKEYEEKIGALASQVEMLHTTVKDQNLLIDQTKKEHHAKLKDMNERMQNKEEELKKIQVELKARTEEVLSFSKDKNYILIRFHNSLKREKSLEVEKVRLEKQMVSLTKKLERIVELEQTVQEYTALQKTAKQWECMLEESKSKFEEERKHLTELQHMFDMKKHELQQTEHEYKEEKKESEILQARVQHLENQLEHFSKEYQSLSQKLEQERRKLTIKHQEEMQVLMLKNVELKQQLQESMAIYEAAKQVPPHVTKKIDDSVSEQIPSEVAQELQLLTL